MHCELKSWRIIMHCDLQSWQSCLGKQTISSTATAVTSARRNGYARSIKKERNRKQYGSQFPYRCIYSELAKQCTSLVRSTFAPDCLFLIFSLLLELLHDHRSRWNWLFASAVHCISRTHNNSSPACSILWLALVAGGRGSPAQPSCRIGTGDSGNGLWQFL